MIHLFNALLPVFGVILAGFVMRIISFPGKDFWPPAERLTYFILFPALLFHSTATASLATFSTGPLFLTLFLATALMVICLFCMRRWLTDDLRSFSSVFQGSIRFNTYVGFSIMLSLYGKEGLALASFTIALLIPLVNLLSVMVIVQATQQNSPLKMIITVLRTPPFIACVLGIIFNASGLTLPEVAANSLLFFGRTSLPLGLLAVGACLQLTTIMDQKKLLFAGVFFKLVLFPLLMFVIASLLHLEPQVIFVAVLFAALPGSASSYILAKQLGGDHQLMANIVTLQIVFSLMALPMILLFLLRGV